MTDSLTH